MQVAQETAGFISSYGPATESHEGVVYWAGVPFDEAWVVTTVMAPKATTTVGSYTTSALANAMVVSRVNELRLQLLAQVHGHPHGWVGHSDGDNTGAFMPYEGFYSVVVPWYGSRGLLPLTTCGIHRYEGGSFVRLSDDEIEDRFVLLPTGVDLRRER